MKYTGRLEAINSKIDKCGNRYWALKFLDFETGREICGKVSGGESNIYGILRHWNAPDDWDRSILFERREMSKKDFNELTKGWGYAGCAPNDLAEYIKNELKKGEK